MRAQLLKVSKGADLSFSVRRDRVPYVNNRWHFHTEVELIHFRTGEGSQFIGDSVKRFKAGDVVLVGSNLPHYWRFDDIYFDECSAAAADVTVSHFEENFWGERFLELPENSALKTLLNNAKRGIVLRGVTRHKVAGLLDKLIGANGAQRIVLLIEALSVIASCNDIEILSSIGFNPVSLDVDSERIEAVYDYTQKNFDRRIELKEISEIANLSQNSFCRYFKSRTGKTYSQYIIELRVGRACKLLIENRLCLKQICFESGFNNFTSFHKYFKVITGKSPLSYQRQFTGG
jgi:AraC-like DNA-binding protein